MRKVQLVLLFAMVFISNSSIANNLFETFLAEFPAAVTNPMVKSIDCEIFFKSPQVTKLLKEYNQIKNLPSAVWDTYRPDLHTVVFTDVPGGFGQCAIVISNSQIVAKLNLKDSIELPNGLYTYYIEKIFEKSVPPELAIFLKSQKLPRSLVYSISPFPGSGGLKPYQIYSSVIGHLNVIVHEGFHLNLMFAKAFGQTTDAWPSWDKQPDRDLDKYCYGHESEKLLIDRERVALNAAFKILYLDNDEKMALDAAKDFLEQRDQRYLAQSNLRVPSPSNPQGVTCAEAESIMELEEGMADFVGTTTSYLLNDLTAYQISEHLQNYHDWYYRSGLAQMLIFKKLDPAGAQAATSRIARSTSWQDGIYSEFKKFIQSRHSKFHHADNGNHRRRVSSP